MMPVEYSAKTIDLPLANLVIDLEREELHDQSGRVVELRPQSFQVLKVLALNAGEIVSKESLRSAVWGDAIVTDDSLVQAVKDIRKALGDADRTIIKTVSRRGYEMIAVAVELSEQSELAQGSDAPPVIKSANKSNRVLAFGIVSVLAAVAIGGWLYLASENEPDAAGEIATESGESVELQTPDMPDRPSIAVLAFDSFGENENDFYLGRGIAEDITTELSRNIDLIVMARNSAFRFQDSELPVTDIASQLGVSFLLEGSVRRSGDFIRINAQLIDGRDGKHIWADKFDAKASSIYEVQDQIVTRITGNLLSGVRESEKARSLRNSPSSLDAYELALRGVAHKHRMTTDHFIEARTDLTRALELDPNLAVAHLYLGYLNAVDISMGSPTGVYTMEDIDIALSSIQHAIELNPDLPTAHQALGYALGVAGRLDEAYAANKSSVELGPSDAENWLFLGFVETKLGRYEDAQQHIDQALDLNPFYPMYYLNIRSTNLYALKRFDEAIEATRSCLAIVPKFNKCRWTLAASLVAANRVNEASSEMEIALMDMPHINARLLTTLTSYVADPQMTERYVADLVAAGLPE